jgi:hypothetical protein
LAGYAINQELGANKCFFRAKNSQAFAVMKQKLKVLKALSFEDQHSVLYHSCYHNHDDHHRVVFIVVTINIIMFKSLANK